MSSNLVSLALLGKLGALALGLAGFGRAIQRRLRRRRGGPPLDHRGLTRGLVALPVVFATLAASARLPVLRLQNGWPAWVATLGFRMTAVVAIVMFALCAWLGLRIVREEVEHRLREHEAAGDESDA